MNDLVTQPIEQIEGEMLKHEQVPCSVVHRFGPGIYIREVSIPAGTFAVGHRQKFEHTNVMLKGRVLIFNEDGSTKELSAPMFFVGKPGRKVGLILEDMVWQNIYATEERDIDKLEAMYLEKSETFNQHETAQKAIAYQAHEDDRKDYLAVLDEFGFSHETALAQSEDEKDQVPMPDGFNVRVLASSIEGKGLFLTSPVEEGELIAPARVRGFRTPAGRYTNHSMTPNAKMVLKADGDIDLMALKRIDGCKGGDQGEEVTIDYRQALALSGLKGIGDNKCQP